MRIGIITATEEEITAIKKYITSSKVNRIFDLNFINGTIGKNEVVLCESGVGKVNASRTTQLLIDNYDVDCVMNIGCAGALKEQLNIGDIVIGKYLVQHDFDITAGGHPKGYISKELGREFFSDTKLIEKCKDIIKNHIKDINIQIGKIATGDVFCQEISLKNDIIKEFNADCVEMEGASIAQVCTLCNIPFIVIRSISDKPNGNNSIDFEKYVVSSAKRFSKVIELLI